MKNNKTTQDKIDEVLKTTKDFFASVEKIINEQNEYIKTVYALTYYQYDLFRAISNLVYYSEIGLNSSKILLRSLIEANLNITYISSRNGEKEKIKLAKQHNDFFYNLQPIKYKDLFKVHLDKDFIKEISSLLKENKRKAKEFKENFIKDEEQFQNWSGKSIAERVSDICKYNGENAISEICRNLYLTLYKHYSAGSVHGNSDELLKSQTDRNRNDDTLIIILTSILLLKVSVEGLADLLGIDIDSFREETSEFIEKVQQ